MSTDNIEIVDVHHHLWDITNNYYPWLSDGVQPSAFGDYTAICKDYLITDFLDDIKNQNVIKSVHMDVGWDPNDPVGETEWLQSVADEHGYPHAIIGFADFSQPDVGELLDRHMEYANFRGVRQSMNFHTDSAKTYTDRPEISREESWRRGFAELQKRDGLTFDLQLYYWQAAEYLDIARLFPDVRILLNHTGMQVDGPSHFDGWRDGMRTLAQAPNVMCKISGLGMGDYEWTTESIRPYVEAALEIFGVERCLFASNFPVDKLFSSYDAIWDAFKEITKDYSDSERTAPFSGNAETFYRI